MNALKAHPQTMRLAATAALLVALVIVARAASDRRPDSGLAAAPAGPSSSESESTSRSPAPTPDEPVASEAPASKPWNRRGLNRGFGGGKRLQFANRAIELRVPRSWTVEDEAGVISVSGDETSLTIRVGNRTGWLRTCDTPARRWERCRGVRITDLATMWHAIRLAPALGCGYCVSVRERRPIRIDGEDGIRWELSGYEYPARGGEHALYVLAMHDGRPYFIRFHTSQAAFRQTPRLWSAIVRTFEFMAPA
jgi:hypothetical protein